MTRRAPLFALGLCALLFAGWPPPTAQGESTYSLRIATLAPRGSGLDRVLRKWSKLLEAQSDGRLVLRVYPGGAAGDERLAIRKMRAGQMDGAIVTTTGLGQIDRASLVLSTPGLIRDYPALDAVRDELGPEFEARFHKAGFTLVSWGDGGRLRLFSKAPIRRPADVQRARPWLLRDDPVMKATLSAIGHPGIALTVPEVYGGLQTGRVDTVIGSALAVVALQWHTQLKYVSKQGEGILVGALVMRNAALDGLPAELKALVLTTGRARNAELRALSRRLDDKAFAALQKRGLNVVDQEPHRPEWEAVGARVRRELTGRLYSAELLERVQAIVARQARGAR